MHARCPKNEPRFADLEAPSLPWWYSIYHFVCFVILERSLHLVDAVTASYYCATMDKLFDRTDLPAWRLGIESLLLYV